MKIKILKTILILLSTTTTVRCLYYEVDLIKRLNNWFDFDHIIYFLDAKIDNSRYIPTFSNSGINNATLSPQTVYVLDENYLNNNGTQLESLLTATHSKNNFLIVVAHTLQSGNMSRLLMHNLQIYGQNRNLKIGVFFTHTSIDSIAELLQWSGSVGIGNIFCAFYTASNDNKSFNVFRFNPFGKFDLINVTGESVQNYFPDKLPNYHKHPLRLAQVDGWNVLYRDTKFWDTVVDVINASISVIHITELHDDETYDDADLLQHISNKVSVNRIYPCRMERAVIVVPHAQLYSSFVEYLKSATWKRLLAYVFIMIVASSIVLVASGWLEKRKILVFQSVADVVNLFMNDNSAIRYGQLNRADVFVIVPITFTGLIVVNYILSLYQSYRTLPIYEHQIDSFDDLYKSPVLILTNGIYWADWIIDSFENLTNYGGWSAKVLRTDFPHLLDEYSKFNNSFAYLGTGNDGPVTFLLAQKLLNLDAYHLIKRPLAIIPFSYKELRPVPIIERINEIIHVLQSAGLLDKWTEDGKRRMVTEIYNENLHLITKNNSNVTTTFSIPPLVWLGWISSVLVFICEILWNKVAKGAWQGRDFFCSKRNIHIAYN